MIDAYELSEEELRARYYRWWAIKAWHGNDRDTGSGIKLGPITLFSYRWFDDRLRVSMTVAGGRERIIFGGPLTR